MDVDRQDLNSIYLHNRPEGFKLKLRRWNPPKGSFSARLPITLSIRMINQHRNKENARWLSLTSAFRSKGGIASRNSPWPWGTSGTGRDRWKPVTSGTGAITGVQQLTSYIYNRECTQVSSQVMYTCTIRSSEWRNKQSGIQCGKTTFNLLFCWLFWVCALR